MQPQTNLGPGAAISQMAGVTVTTMVLIGIGVILAVLVIWWGAKKKRERKSAESELVDNGAVRDGDAPVEEADVTPPPPASPPREDAAAAAPPAPSPQPDAAPITTPPVAPAPPPLENEATPLVAVAPDVPAAPAGNDDLTQMKGVGPKLAARLNELGIHRYADIAALDPAAAEALDLQLGSFRGRLVRDRWIEQAAYLAAGNRAGFEAAFGRL